MDFRGEMYEFSETEIKNFLWGAHAAGMFWSTARRPVSLGENRRAADFGARAACAPHFSMG